MIKNLIGILIMAACVAGGAFGAYSLKPAAEPVIIAESVATAQAGDAEAASVTHGKETPKQDDAPKAGGGHGEASEAGSRAYYKFTRQFLVPVVSEGNIQSLVILDLNLEVEPNMTEKIFAVEPKIRDVLMTELLALSNEGRFAERLTDPANYAEIRERLLAAVHRVTSEGVYNVLILDIARQDT